MKEPNKDTATLVKLVKEYRRKHCPALSIDTILTRPFDAMKLGLYVASRRQQIPTKIGLSIARSIDVLVKKHPVEVDAMDDVLRGALNSRKRGHFRGNGD